MKDNVSPLVEKLIDLKSQLAPLERDFDDAKELIRDVGPDTYTIPGKGKVIVSEPSVRKPKGTQVVLDAEALEQASPKLQAQLFQLGILKSETQYTRASKSKVEVKLEAA